MDYIIPNIKSQNVMFCGYEQLAIILNLHNIHFVKDVLGLDWSFSYTRKFGEGIGIEFEKWLPEYVISTEYTSVRDVLKKYYGFELVRCKFDNSSDILNAMKKDIKMGHPLIVSCDPFCLPYFAEYKVSHAESPHYILMFGFNEDNQELIYYDSTRRFEEGSVHRYSYQNIDELFSPTDNVYHLKPEYIKLIQNGSKKDGRLLLAGSVSDMLMNKEVFSDNSVTYMGINGIRVLCKDMYLMGKWGNEELMNRFFDSFKDMVVLCAQQRYGNYLKLLEINEGSSIKEKLLQIYKKWNALKLNFINPGKQSAVSAFEQGSNTLREIADLEEKFLLEFVHTIECNKISPTG